MSISSRSDSSSSSSSLDLEELLNIGARCGELRKEKDLLKASHSQSYGLIKRLELHVKRLNEARSEDKRQIRELETELRSCCDEIESLQDKLTSRNEEIDSLGKHVHSLDVKLSNMGTLQDEFVLLTEELNQSKLEVLSLKEEVERKELELMNSTLCIDRLEETISSSVLESQCEIESLRLEMLRLEQSSLECKRSEEDAHVIIETLEQENNELRYMLDASQTQASLFVEKVEEHFRVLLENVKCVQGNLTSDFGQLGIEPSKSDVSLCGEVLGPLLLKMLSLGTFKQKSVEAERMSRQIQEYELLVKRLREELKEEKLKAKEESEDLAQEMAELRYQLTELLDEERKHRACIEQISLHRIVELEKQLQIERRKAMLNFKKSPLQKLSKHSSVDPPITRGKFSNPFDSDDESDNKPTLAPAKRTTSEPSLISQGSNTNPFDDYDAPSGEGKQSATSYGYAQRNKYKNDFRDSGGLENQSVQELESYAVYKSEETTKTVNSCLRIAEDIREDATRTLVTLHQQGEQITRTHQAAADIDHDLSRGEKLLGSLGGMFSKTWKPTKTRPITGPVITRDDPVSRKINHLEQREKLGLSSASNGRPKTRTPPPEATNAIQKVEFENAKQDDTLSDLSDLLGELKDMAIDMGSEINRQNKTLDPFNDDVDELGYRVQNANRRGNRLLRK
ncbi:hypothetical protein V2J09_020452 [Rumex salicifolius]